MVLRRRGPRSIVKAVSNCIYKVQDLCNGMHEDMNVSRLKFYRDSDLESDAIMSLVLTSETGMVVSRLVGLEESPNSLCIRVPLRGLPESEDTRELISIVHKDVPQLFAKFLKRKATSDQLAAKNRAELGP